MHSLIPPPHLWAAGVLLGGWGAPAVLAYNAEEVLGDGPYSSAQAKYNPNAIDQGIAGFVGDDGDGVANFSGTEINYVNPVFSQWAADVTDYSPSDTVGTYGQNGIGAQFGDPAKALGAVTGDNFDIVSLGDRSSTEIANGTAPGTLTVSFATAVTNGDGADFAVFENGFISAGGAGVSGQIFAELTYCEVSTDGVTFARLPSVSLTQEAVGAYGTVDPTEVYNLVGKHVNAYGSSWGTAFDLDTLANDTLVKNGTVDLNNIQYVRLVDIAGDGSQTDSLGNPIYDAWVTWGSGGADIDAIGAIRHLGEAQAVTAGSGAAGWGWNSANGALRLEYTGLANDAEFTATAYTGAALAELAGRGTVLNAWTLDTGSASFSADGMARLFAYFSTTDFAGDVSRLQVLRWDGTAWQPVGIAGVDLDNFLLTSAWLAGSDLTTFAVLQVPEPTVLAGLAAATALGLCSRPRRKQP